MKIWGLGQISPAEKQDILSKHRELYNGYKTMLPQVSNTQPLYTQDYANDKNGLVVNNKGEVKKYTNVGINESIEEGDMCEQCGGEMKEGICEQCSSEKEMREDFGMEDMDDTEDLAPVFKGGEFIGMEKSMGDMEDVEIEKSDIEKVKKQFRPGLDLGKSFDKFKGMMENTGKLSDIYNVEDLGDSDYDYVEGGGNDYGTFEKMHHMKKIKSEQTDNTVDFQPTDDFVDGYDDTDNEDDGFEDLQVGDGEMYEQGYTGGGNAPDMDLSNIKSAYDFVSDGPGDVYPTEGELEEYETMESAWAEDLEEMNDVSGVQGVYGDMKPAFDFDSKGPGSAGPYQRSSWGGGVTDKDIEEQEFEDDDVYWQKDLEDNELDLDLTKFNPEDKSWEEITAYTGEDEFSNLDEDIRESFLKQKNRISEMFVRMKVIK
jgi:hypothetical protein